MVRVLAHGWGSTCRPASVWSSTRCRTTSRAACGHAVSRHSSPKSCSIARRSASGKRSSAMAHLRTTRQTHPSRWGQPAIRGRGAGGKGERHGLPVGGVRELKEGEEGTIAGAVPFGDGAKLAVIFHATLDQILFSHGCTPPRLEGF